MLKRMNEEICTDPQMIPARKWSHYRKWSQNKTGNDPQIVPQTIPGTEMVALLQMKEMSGLWNLDNGFNSSICSQNYQQPI